MADKIQCSLECDIPEGVTLTEVPAPRHDWTDVIRCPNIEEGCERVFMISPKAEKNG